MEAGTILNNVSHGDGSLQRFNSLLFHISTDIPEKKDWIAVSSRITRDKWPKISLRPSKLKVPMK